MFHEVIRKRDSLLRKGFSFGADVALTDELQRRRRDTKLGTKFHQTQATKHSQQRTRKQSQWLQEDVLSEILYVKLTFVISATRY